MMNNRRERHSSVALRNGNGSTAAAAAVTSTTSSSTSKRGRTAASAVAGNRSLPLPPLLKAVNAVVLTVGPILLLAIFLFQPIPTSFETDVTVDVVVATTVTSGVQQQQQQRPSPMPMPQSSRHPQQQQPAPPQEHLRQKFQAKNEIEKQKEQDSDDNDTTEDNDEDESDDDDEGTDSIAALAPLHADPVLRYLERELSGNDDNGTMHHQLLHDAMDYQHANCILPDGDGDDEMEFCPSLTSPDAWRLRTPGFLIIGAKKAGTTSFWQSMVSSGRSNIVGGRVKELLFFTQVAFNFTKYTRMVDETLQHTLASLNATPINTHYPKLFRHYANASAFQILVGPTRNDFQATTTSEYFNTTLLRHDRPHAVSLDATPEYLFNFPTSSKAILCTVPWVKLLIIVRHPTDRVWSHYHYLQQQLKKRQRPPMKMSFEEFVLADARKLQQLGLVEEKVSSNQTTTTTTTTNEHVVLTEEKIVRAWFEYKQAFPEGPLGRSMYALQIHQWFKELRKIGRDPKNAVKIVRLEDLKRGGPKASQILHELADWVLPESGKEKKEEEDTSAHRRRTTANNTTTTSDYSSAFRHGMQTDYSRLGSPKLSRETKELLDKFYAPHNAMLSRLLGDDRWQYSRDDANNDRPLVWPPSEGGDDGALFAGTTIDEKGPCTPR